MTPTGVSGDVSEPSTATSRKPPSCLVTLRNCTRANSVKWKLGPVSPSNASPSKKKGVKRAKSSEE